MAAGDIKPCPGGDEVRTRRRMGPADSQRHLALFGENSPWWLELVLLAVGCFVGRLEPETIGSEAGALRLNRSGLPQPGIPPRSRPSETPQAQRLKELVTGTRRRLRVDGSNRLPAAWLENPLDSAGRPSLRSDVRVS